MTDTGDDVGQLELNEGEPVNEEQSKEEVKEKMMEDEKETPASAPAGDSEVSSVPEKVEVAEFVEKPIIAREWKSDLDVERQVGNLHVKQNRGLIGFRIIQCRARFGRKYDFNDREPRDKLYEHLRHKILDYDVDRRVLSMGMQYAPSTTEEFTQTLWRARVNQTSQYEPQSLATDQQKSALESEAMSKFMQNVESRFRTALRDNEVSDIFRDEFDGFEDEEASVGNRAESNLKELHSFTDMNYSKNHKITAVEWHPNKAGVVIFACSNGFLFDQWVEISGKVISSAILIWNFQDLLHPELVLEVPGDVTCFKINPDNNNIIVAGLFSGQIVLYDLGKIQGKTSAPQQGTRPGRGNRAEEKVSTEEQQRAAQTGPVKCSMISWTDRSHGRAVTDLVWLSKSHEVNRKGDLIPVTDNVGHSSQLISVCGDGLLYFWDLRARNDTKPTQSAGPFSKASEEESKEMKWVPLVTISLNRPEASGLIQAQIIFHNQQETTNLIAATEDGELAVVDWAAKPVDDKVKAPTVVKVNKGHYQPVVAMQRSPFFQDVYLTVGDWTFSIWRLDLDVPLLTSACASDYLTCGAWSSTRPGVVVVGRADGIIEVWDLLDQCHRASLSQSLGSDAITSLKFWHSQANQQLAVGDAGGKLHIVEMPRNLRRKLPKEEELMQSFFQREIKRVQYHQKRAASRASEKKIFEERAAAMGTLNKAPKEEQKHKDKQAEKDEVAELNYQRMLKEMKAQLLD